MQMKISLSEALTGFSRTVTTLDGSKIAVTQIPGDFVKHEGWLELKKNFTIFYVSKELIGLYRRQQHTIEISPKKLFRNYNLF